MPHTQPSLLSLLTTPLLTTPLLWTNLGSMSNTQPSLLSKLCTPLPTAFLLGALCSMSDTNSPPFGMIGTPLKAALLLRSVLDTNFSILSIVRTSLRTALFDLGPVPTAYPPVERDVVTSLGAASLETCSVFHAECPILGFVGASLVRANFDSSAVLDTHAAVDYVVGAAGTGADGIIIIFSWCRRFSRRCSFGLFRGGGGLLLLLLVRRLFCRSLSFAF